jgi:hypothetical protein
MDRDHIAFGIVFCFLEKERLQFNLHRDLARKINKHIKNSTANIQ